MRVSSHAAKRLKDRDIIPQDVVECIKEGIRMTNKWDDNKWTFKHKTKNLYAVSDKSMSVLITVFRKEQ